MGFFELFLIGIGLSMDAFAVAICKGLGMERINKRDTLLLALFFGGFQALMPLIGYFAGVLFQGYITAIDHWIAFALLALIGINMIREAFSKKEEPADASLGFRSMLVLSIATSIDALASGITFAFLNVNIIWAVCFIGVTTLIISALGVKIGGVFGTKFKSKAELAGGIILILLGLKILLSHLAVSYTHLTLPTT